MREQAQNVAATQTGGSVESTQAVEFTEPSGRKHSLQEILVAMRKPMAEISINCQREKREKEMMAQLMNVERPKINKKQGAETVRLVESSLT